MWRSQQRSRAVYICIQKYRFVPTPPPPPTEKHYQGSEFWSPGSCAAQATVCSLPKITHVIWVHMARLDFEEVTSGWYGTTVVKPLKGMRMTSFSVHTDLNWEV